MQEAVNKGTCLLSGIQPNHSLPFSRYLRTHIHIALHAYIYVCVCIFHKYMHIQEAVNKHHDPLLKGIISNAHKCTLSHTDIHTQAYKFTYQSMHVLMHSQARQTDWSQLFLDLSITITHLFWLLFFFILLYANKSPLKGGQVDSGCLMWKTQKGVVDVFILSGVFVILHKDMFSTEHHTDTPVNETKTHSIDERTHIFLFFFFPFFLWFFMNFFCIGYVQYGASARKGVKLFDCLRKDTARPCKRLECDR